MPTGLGNNWGQLDTTIQNQWFTKETGFPGLTVWVRLLPNTGEMRRLAATGWKPPIERITTTGGPTIQGAADAIEETERRRRAYAKEARRRAEARQNDSVAMREQFDVRRRAEDQKGLNKKLDETEDLLNQVEGNLGTYGVFTEGESAKALRRYLDEAGGIVHYGPEYLRQFDAVKNPEARIQQHFIDWMKNPKVQRETVYVDGLPRTMSVTSKWERIGEELLSLRDGETIERSSYWTAPFDWSTLPGMVKWTFGVPRAARSCVAMETLDSHDAGTRSSFGGL